MSDPVGSISGIFGAGLTGIVALSALNMMGNLAEHTQESYGESRRRSHSRSRRDYDMLKENKHTRRSHNEYGIFDFGDHDVSQYFGGRY